LDDRTAWPGGAHLEAPRDPAEPAWSPDARLGRARLRAFLAAQPEGAHALLVAGTRLSALAVAEDLAALARQRGLALVVVGRASLRGAALERGWPFVPEEALLASRLPDRLRRELERGPSARAALALIAPSLACARGIAELDAQADPLPGLRGRFCLLPKGAIRSGGPQAALQLADRHGASLVLA
jgi:hypothetical protein